MLYGDDDSLRVGIIGLGGMGRSHADAAIELGHEIVAGVDVVPEIRETFSTEYEARTYESQDDLFEAEDIDAVVIATPNVHHEVPAVGALERDVSVLVEKPLAADLEGAERIAAAAADSDAIGMVGFQNRFAPAADLIQAYKDDGFFGDIVHVEANFIRRRGIPKIGSWFTDAKLAGGGALIDIGVHAIDFGLALAGFPEPVEVSGVTRSIYAGKANYANVDGYSPPGGSDEEMAFDVEDSATAFLRCADGCTVSIDISWALNRPPERDIWLLGTEGGAKTALGSEEATLYDATTTGQDHYVDTQLSGATGVDKRVAQMEHFATCVAEGREPDISTIEQGVTVQRVIDGIYRASETGRAVSLADDQPVARTQQSRAN